MVPLQPLPRFHQITLAIFQLMQIAPLPVGGRLNNMVNPQSYYPRKSRSEFKIKFNRSDFGRIRFWPRIEILSEQKILVKIHELVKNSNFWSKVEIFQNFGQQMEMPGKILTKNHHLVKQRKSKNHILLFRGMRKGI